MWSIRSSSACICFMASCHSTTPRRTNVIGSPTIKVYDPFLVLNTVSQNSFKISTKGSRVQPFSTAAAVSGSASMLCSQNLEFFNGCINCSSPSTKRWKFFSKNLSTNPCAVFRSATLASPTIALVRNSCKLSETPGDELELDALLSLALKI